MPDRDDKPLCPRCFVPLRVEVTAHHLRIFCESCQREYVKYHSTGYVEGSVMPKRSLASSSAYLCPVGYEYEFILDGDPKGPTRVRYRVVGHGEVDAPGDDRLAGKREIVMLVEEKVVGGGLGRENITIVEE